MTTLVIDLPTQRVIWFTTDPAALIDPPDERSATVQFDAALPPEMTLRNCFQYVLKGHTLSWSGKAPAPTPLELAQNSATVELKRKHSVAAARDLSATDAGREARRLKLRAAVAGDLSSPWIRLVADQMGVPVSAVPDRLITMEVAQSLRLCALEGERLRVQRLIAAARTPSEATAAALSFNVKAGEA
jgi:hypothetical protein